MFNLYISIYTISFSYFNLIILSFKYNELSFYILLSIVNLIIIIIVILIKLIILMYLNFLINILFLKLIFNYLIYNLNPNSNLVKLINISNMFINLYKSLLSFILFIIILNQYLYVKYFLYL